MNGRNTLVERDLKTVEVLKSAIFIFTAFRESKLLYVLMVFHEYLKNNKVILVVEKNKFTIQASILVLY